MKSVHRLIYLLAIVKFILPFILANPYYQLHRDEYLYLAEGHHLDWGFMEVPPTMSLLAWVSNSFGASIFWTKFWPALAGSLTFILVAKMILSLGGKTFAIVLAFLPFVFTGYIRLFYFFHPNFLDAFFWALIAYTLFRYAQTHNNKFIYYFWISVGLGMMSKYSVAFYATSMLIGLSLTRQRKIFQQKHFYIGATVAFLICLPNLIWQYQHRFPVIKHMRELQNEQLQFIDPRNFLISQLFMFLPCAFIWLAGLYFSAIASRGKPFRFVAIAYLSVLILLLLLHGKDYYSVGAYPVLFAIGAYYLEKLTEKRFGLFRYAMVAVPIFLGVLVFPVLMPIAKPEVLARFYRAFHIDKSGALRWEDQHNHSLPQDFSDMVGWRETAEKTAKVFKSMSPADRSKTLVYCRGYYFAGALNYYAGQVGLPQVYSDNASFLFWMPEKYDVKNLILIAHEIPDANDIVFNQFEKRTVMDSLNNPLARENGVKVILYQNGNDHVNDLIAKSIADQKAEFTR